MDIDKEKIEKEWWKKLIWIRNKLLFQLDLDIYCDDNNKDFFENYLFYKRKP